MDERELETKRTPSGMPDSIQLLAQELEAERLQKERRMKRMEEMRRQKKRQELMRKRVMLCVKLAGTLVCTIVVAVFGGILFRKYSEHAVRKTVSVDELSRENGETEAVRTASSKDVSSRDEASSDENQESDVLEEFTGAADGAKEEHTDGGHLFFDGYAAKIDEDTPYIASEEMLSTYAVLVDLDTGDVVAQREAQTVINPASMTKILTLLVAAEHVTDLDDTFTMTIEITDYAYVNDCSTAGFLKDEEISVRDLMYGTILPSGGEAAAALAIYTAGSLDAFAEMMNEKLKELGLSGTAHFTNCIGLYDENHHCSVYDMAMILKAAVENELCREVLSAHTYTTSATEEHPEGINLSNLFLRRIEDKDTHGEVICAKTGFVDQSGSCGASYAVSDSGKHYICVTGNAWSSWRCIYDHVEIYQQYTD